MIDVSALVGHMMNAQFALESGGTKREAIDILKRGIALAAGSRRAETNEDLAQCEASQSGAAKTAQRPTPPIVR